MASRSQRYSKFPLEGGTVVNSYGVSYQRSAKSHHCTGAIWSQIFAFGRRGEGEATFQGDTEAVSSGTGWVDRAIFSALIFQE